MRDKAFNFMNLYDTLQVYNLKKGTPRWLTRLTGFTTAREGTHSVHGLFLLGRNHFTLFSDKSSHFFPLCSFRWEDQFSTPLPCSGMGIYLYFRLDPSLNLIASDKTVCLRLDMFNINWADQSAFLIFSVQV